MIQSKRLSLSEREYTYHDKVTAQEAHIAGEHAVASYLHHFLSVDGEGDFLIATRVGLVSAVRDQVAREGGQEATKKDKESTHCIPVVIHHVWDC